MLRGELGKLMELNQQISQEAHNLTKALKGDTKKQGNWGELILERVLESSGLEKGREYELQFSTSNDEGKRIQPDVVVYLPENKHLIIDAKVSLTGYEKVVNANTTEERARGIREHVVSLKSHIKGLGEKNYSGAKDLESPDFVLLFMPIESAFGLALQADDALYDYAWERKIVLVSPTTLLATLRTISSIWKQEKQTRFALEIAEESGRLYDKFVGFMGDMQGVGRSLDQSQRQYGDAMKKLSEGRGNMLDKMEKLREMGAKSSKTLKK
jgi:DNA recombination protein RmuC